jgi:hypothetical protein
VGNRRRSLARVPSTLKHPIGTNRHARAWNESTVRTISTSRGTATGTAKSSGIGGSVREPDRAFEAVTPELVLVDPELARAARSRLPERTWFEAPADIRTTSSREAAASPDAAEAAPPQVPYTAAGGWRDALRRTRDRMTPVLLFISLMTNAVLIAAAVAGARADQPAPVVDAALREPEPQSSVPQVRTTSATHSSTKKRRSRPPRKSSTARRSAPASRPATRARRIVASQTNAAVERKLLRLIIQSPAGRLPRYLINSRTGLAKNNLQAICRRSTRVARTFLCVVRPARHKPGEGLYVRYRPGRGQRGAFTWYRYRRG